MAHYELHHQDVHLAFIIISIFGVLSLKFSLSCLSCLLSIEIKTVATVLSENDNPYCFEPQGGADDYEHHDLMAAVHWIHDIWLEDIWSEKTFCILNGHVHTNAFSCIVGA